MTTDVGLYIHIPFCKKRCNYCDFCSSVLTNEGQIEEYLDFLLDEAEEYRGRGISIDTLYIGGGTPSLMPPKALKRLLCGLLQIFSFNNLIEFSVEANPGTLSFDKLKAYRELGVNRLSIGLQSTSEAELKALGRIHTYEDFLLSYNEARRAGFENISVDLMYGIPKQSLLSLEKSLTLVTSLGVDHLSLYGLIVEPDTPFFENREKLNLPSEDTEAAMYALGCSMLRRRGYSHYEISNYAKEGRECRHNLKYWRNEQYIGLGMSAYSYFDACRYGNSCKKEEYYSHGRAKYRQVEKVSPYDERFEYAMMRLRLGEGINLRDYKAHFSEEFFEKRADKINKYIDLGLVRFENGRIFLTEKGFYLSNTVMSDIL